MVLFFVLFLFFFSLLIVYYCPECDANTTTFPRYNRAQKLLETKQGRCGEYSNLFGLFCRSVGLETRLILDLSDHLWTEVRLGDSWIMVDSCEGIIDKASMYDNEHFDNCFFDPRNPMKDNETQTLETKMIAKLSKAMNTTKPYPVSPNEARVTESEQ